MEIEGLECVRIKNWANNHTRKRKKKTKKKKHEDTASDKVVVPNRPGSADALNKSRRTETREREREMERETIGKGWIKKRSTTTPNTRTPSIHTHTHTKWLGPDGASFFIPLHAHDCATCRGDDENMGKGAIQTAAHARSFAPH